MTLQGIVLDLTIAVIAKVDMDQDPYKAADEAVGVYENILLELKDTQVSSEALQIALAVLGKTEVSLGSPPGVEAARICKHIQEELPSGQ